MTEKLQRPRQVCRAPRLARMRGATQIAVAMSLSLAPHAAVADRASDARLLAAQCAQCHGTDGASAGGIDSLAGMEYNDLLDKMLDMSRPGETGDIMKHQAKGYTSYQLRLIAEYFSQLAKSEDD